MHTFLKVSVPLILFGIIVIVVVIPVVLHFHKDDKQGTSTSTTKPVFQGVLQNIFTTTTTTRRPTNIAVFNMLKLPNTTTRISTTITNTRLTSTTGTTPRLSTIATTISGITTTAGTTSRLTTINGINNLSTNVLSTYSSNLSTNGGIYCQFGNCGVSYYYAAIQINVSVEGNYTIRGNSTVATYGYIYNDTFHPFFYKKNMLNYSGETSPAKPFGIVMLLRPMTKYILVATSTFPYGIGPLSINVVGPSSVNLSRYNVPSPIYSKYSSVLNSNSSMYSRDGYRGTMNYYYEAFEINVSISDYYVIMSNSSIDTYGFIYTNNFNPYVVTANQNSSDDQSGGNNQFLFELILQPLTKYILIVTTYRTNITGSFSVLVLGSSSVNISRYNVPIPVFSQYLSALNSNSSMFALQNYLVYLNSYFEAIEINVFTSDYYTIAGNSTINTFGILYTTSFSPYVTYINQKSVAYRTGGNNQFFLELRLENSTKYILVVTTSTVNITGAFSVIGYGPSSINISRYNLPIEMKSQYSSNLNNNNSMFSRDGTSKIMNYYYEAIEINVSTSGYYLIKSNSIINTYGILYTNNFDPYLASTNRQLVDDNSGGNNQFTFGLRLENSTKYFLVVTTSTANITGAFSVIVTGPSLINMSRFNVPNQCTLMSTTAVNSSMINSNHSCNITACRPIIAHNILYNCPYNTTNYYQCAGCSQASLPNFPENWFNLWYAADFVIFSWFNQDCPGNPRYGDLKTCQQWCLEDITCVGFSRAKPVIDDDPSAECYLKFNVELNRTFGDSLWQTIVFNGTF